MNVGFIASVEFKDKVLFSMINGNALFLYDLKSGQTKYLGRFEKENIASFLHMKAFLNNGKAWFMPYEGKYISVVDLNSYAIEYLPLNGEEYGKYEFFVRNMNTIYAIPGGVGSKKIISIDLTKNKVADCCEGRAFEDRFIGGFIEGDLLYGVSSSGDINLKYNIKSKKIEYYNQNNDSSEFNSIVTIGKKIVCIPEKSPYILIQDIHDETKKEIHLINSSDEFYNGIINGTDVILLPLNYSRRCLVLHNVCDDSIRLDMKKILPVKKGRLYCSKIANNDNNVLIATSFGDIFKINRDYDICEIYKAIVTSSEKLFLFNDFKRYESLIECNNEVLYEDCGMQGLDAFIISVI